VPQSGDLIKVGGGEATMGEGRKAISKVSQEDRIVESGGHSHGQDNLQQLGKVLNERGKKKSRSSKSR